MKREGSWVRDLVVDGHIYGGLLLLGFGVGLWQVAAGIALVGAALVVLGVRMA